MMEALITEALTLQVYKYKGCTRDVQGISHRVVLGCQDINEGVSPVQPVGVAWLAEARSGGDAGVSLIGREGAAGVEVNSDSSVQYLRGPPDADFFARFGTSEVTNNGYAGNTPVTVGR
jgi:hypothetical protein